MLRPHKPLGIKAYGHIPHLPGSRMGPGDHTCHEGQARICTVRVRDRHDTIVVQEKADGSCTAVARLDDTVVALGRAGYPAQSSPYEQHKLFADWVRRREPLFLEILQPGERLVGEWLAQAHGTRYVLPHDPWVVFDLMRGVSRIPYEEFRHRVGDRLVVPHTIHVGGSLSVEAAMQQLEVSAYGALDPVEGAVWRVERNGSVDFLAKWVRPDKLDGRYLPEISGTLAVWNWCPGKNTET